MEPKSKRPTQQAPTSPEQEIASASVKVHDTLTLKATDAQALTRPEQAIASGSGKVHGTLTLKATVAQNESNTRSKAVVSGYVYEIDCKKVGDHVNVNDLVSFTFCDKIIFLTLFYVSKSICKRS